MYEFNIEAVESEIKEQHGVDILIASNPCTFSTKHHKLLMVQIFNRENGEFIGAAPFTSLSKNANEVLRILVISYLARKMNYELDHDKMVSEGTLIELEEK